MLEKRLIICQEVERTVCETSAVKETRSGYLYKDYYMIVNGGRGKSIQENERGLGETKGIKRLTLQL